MVKVERIFVWCGGTIFVTALAFCGYSYLVTWATPLHDTYVVVGGRIFQLERGWPSLAADIGLFGIFAAHHSMFARESVKARLTRVLPERLLRSVYVWTASLLLVLVCTLWQPIGQDLYHVTGWRAAAHAAAQVSGLWMIASAVRAIDALDLAGIRRHSARETLHITGPYGWVRHPLYLGWMLAAFGAAHMTADRLTFAAISSLYLIVAIPWEERSLARAFPDAYRRYTQQVRWRIVPYVY